MNTEFKRYKKLYYANEDILKIVILCKRRNMHIFNLNTLSIDDSFQLEGTGEPGEFFVDEKNFKMLMVNKTTQLININISEKINNRQIPLDKNENNLCEILLNDEFIHSMNWGLINVKCQNNNNKIIIVNAQGIKIYKYENNWIEEHYSSSILKMSGCGACSLQNDMYAYGDLAGNLTIFNDKTKKHEQIQFKNEMIRSLCSDTNNKIIYIGTLSGKIFIYNYNNKNLSTLQNNIKDDNDNKETITCMRFIFPNLYYSDTGGYFYVYNSYDKSIIYKYLAHEPKKDNTNEEFGSLSIKSEVWSLLIHEIDNEYNYVVTGSEDQSIKIWKIKFNSDKNIVKKNQLIREIKEHKYAVTCLV
jgi:WD40 repeat protein